MYTLAIDMTVKEEQGYAVCAVHFTVRAVSSAVLYQQDKVQQSQVSQRLIGQAMSGSVFSAFSVLLAACQCFSCYNLFHHTPRIYIPDTRYHLVCIYQTS